MEAASRRGEIEEEQRRNALWDKVYEWENSSNPLLRAKAYKLGKKLAAEEGIEV
jgi:hypothetical protein